MRQIPKDSTGKSSVQGTDQGSSSQHNSTIQRHNHVPSGEVVHISEHVNIDPRKLSNLNSYSFYPSTVPPFALDEHFQKAKVKSVPQEQLSLMATPDYKNTNQYLTSHDEEWTKFASNIGSNVAYTGDRTINLATNRSISRTSTIFRSSTTDSSTLDDQEKDLIRNEVLQDLNGEWGGETRLEAIYNLPLASDYKLKNQKDRNDWADYIGKAQKFYYGKGYSKRKNIAPEVPDELKASEETVQNNNSHHIDWLDELNRDKERLRALRKRKVQQWKPKLIRLLLENQYLPLTFRIIIGILSVISLAIAVRIFQNSDTYIVSIEDDIDQQPSTIMAICVNSIAIVYTAYIALDEFSGQPLGLRNPLSKLKLILLDLLFIIFSSANLALAFNTRYDKQWVCTPSYIEHEYHRYPGISYICKKQKALSSFLFILLFMWVVAFTVSIVRVVEKVSSNLSRD